MKCEREFFDDVINAPAPCVSLVENIRKRVRNKKPNKKLLHIALLGVNPLNSQQPGLSRTSDNPKILIFLVLFVYF